MDTEPINVKNPQEEREHGNPIFDQKPDLGDENRVAEVTETNQAMDQALGFDPAEGDREPRLNDISNPENSAGEQMPGDSAEEKAQDALNGGVLRI